MRFDIELSREHGEYCFFCLAEIPKDIDVVGILYEWGSGRRLTYCRYHYEQVEKFQEKQRCMYEQSKWKSKGGEKSE